MVSSRAAERFDALSTRTGELDDRSNRSLPGRPRPHIQHGLLLEDPHSAISKTNGRGDENHSGITRRELDACVEEVENTLNVWEQVMYDRVVLDSRHHRGERSQDDRPLRSDAARGGGFAGLVCHGAITPSLLSRVSTNWRLIVTHCGSVPDVDIGGFNVLQILGIKNHRIQI